MKTKEPNAPATAELQLAHSPQQMDIMDAMAEIEKLRRENDILRKGVASPPNGLSAAQGKLRRYRVKLPGLRPMRSSRVVVPRLTAPQEMRLLPPVSYPDLDLFMNEAGCDPANLEAAAWKRYCAEGHQVGQIDGEGRAFGRPIDALRDKGSFYINAHSDGQVEHLDFPARSPADAFALFCRFCSILGTTQKPEVTDLGPVDDEEASTPALEPVGMV